MRVVSVVLAVVLLAGLAGVAPAVGASGATASAVATVERPANSPATDGSSHGDLHQQVHFDLTPSVPGSVTVTVTYDPSSDVRTFVVGPREGASVRSTDGFDPRNGGDGWAYEWDGVTDDPTVTYTVGNTTSGSWGMDSVDAGEWALVEPAVPPTAFYSLSDDAWTYSYDDASANRITRETSASTEYHLGGRYLFLGDHEVRTVTDEGVTVEAVVPAVAELGSPPAETLRWVFDAAALPVGGRDDVVTMFYAPEPLAQQGLSDGEAAFWVGATRTDSVFAHEYVHTRQDYTPAPSMEWFAEGSADYYEYRQRLTDGDWTYEEFARTMDDSADGVVLTDPDTFAFNAGDYVEGRRLLAALDHRIREATDDERTLDDVFRRMNAHEGELTYDEFVGIVEAVSGAEMEPWLDRYATTERSPPVPDESYLSDGDSDADPDDDGLTVAEEDRRGTDPYAADTDGDGLDDGREVQLGTDPTSTDTDGDGAADGREVELGTDPTDPDSPGETTTAGDDRSTATTTATVGVDAATTASSATDTPPSASEGTRRAGNDATTTTAGTAEYVDLEGEGGLPGPGVVGTLLAAALALAALRRRGRR